jgi:hypothetical protein
LCDDRTVVIFVKEYGQLYMLIIFTVLHVCNILSRPSGGVIYRDTWSLDWLQDLLDTPLTILNYSVQSIALSLFYMVCSSLELALSLLRLLPLHQSSGTSFHWRTFHFLGSRTIPAPATATLDSQCTHHLQLLEFTNFSYCSIWSSPSNYWLSIPVHTLCVPPTHSLSLPPPRWYYDIRSVGQSAFVSSTSLGSKTRVFLFLFLRLTFAWLLKWGDPLWREDGSVVCSAVTQWSQSQITYNHTLLSHLRHPIPGRPGSRIYIPMERGGPVTSPRTGFLYVAKTRRATLVDCKV